MFISHQGQRFELEEGVDVGYGVEKINMYYTDGKPYSTPTRGTTTLLISAPTLDKGTLLELLELDKEFKSTKTETFEAVFVLKDKNTLPGGFEFIRFVADIDNEYGVEFGTLIDSDAPDGKLAKAVFVISRDHILFYKEICKDTNDLFNIERLYQHLGRALNVYTGTGCH